MEVAGTPLYSSLLESFAKQTCESVCAALCRRECLKEKKSNQKLAFWRNKANSKSSLQTTVHELTNTNKTIKALKAIKIVKAIKSIKAIKAIKAIKDIKDGKETKIINATSYKKAQPLGLGYCSLTLHTFGFRLVKQFSTHQMAVV